MATIVLQDADREGDTVTVSATVDGKEFVVHFLVEAVTDLTKAQRQQFVAQLFKTTADRRTKTTIPLAGTVSL